MKWKDSDENQPSESGQINDDDDYVDEETYSPWQKRALGDWLSMRSGKSLVPYILVAFGVILLVVVLGGILSTKSGEQADTGEIGILADRIRQLEERLGDLEQNMVPLSRVDELEKGNAQLKSRLDRTTSALALKVDLVAKKLDGLKRPPVAKKKPATKPPVKTAQKAPARYHEVSTGETLFSISRKYGLTVDQLMQMNKISKGDPIHPGQKLTVGGQ